jgi:hypothetical protein
MIEVEQATEPFASADRATAVIGGCHERRAEESIADALVVAFQIVVPNVLGDDESEMPLAKWDDAAQALTTNRANEALSVSIEIRASGRQADASDASRSGASWRSPFQTSDRDHG